MKLSKLGRGIIAVSGGFMVHFIIGNLYLWGSISMYLNIMIIIDILQVIVIIMIIRKLISKILLQSSYHL